MDDLTVQHAHRYIDGHSNYVVIVRLVNGNLIALYSEKELVDNGERNKGLGFILSLNNKKLLKVNHNIENSRATDYNQYYIVFGNDEMSISLAENHKISGNCGHVYSFYRPKVNNSVFFG